ncbi:MAG: tetratricopeptide repeat protein [Roseofilum sp. SBFL]|uniref:tetratricopeptide repeat protein n=1 Tax=Roseofilum sp. SBFL TaxID=2821496 RepID=UPI001B1C45DF|nr:tetratricopeptide repeat protein [Roseofilum sp. SBFL]MBP0040818.1 tetratricopeptide repeat protein [Roseofilum sp. SBFL]
MTQTAEDLFNEGIERYKKGESPATLIPLFKDICDRSPKQSTAWTCLAWLYLLEDKPKSAYKAAQKAVKLNPEDPQARVNMAAAMLETNKSGVREHIDIAQRLIMAVSEYRQEIEENCKEGLNRKPDWQNLQRIYDWLFLS